MDRFIKQQIYVHLILGLQWDLLVLLQESQLSCCGSLASHRVLKCQTLQGGVAPEPLGRICHHVWVPPWDAQGDLLNLELENLGQFHLSSKDLIVRSRLCSGKAAAMGCRTVCAWL